MNIEAKLGLLAWSKNDRPQCDVCAHARRLAGDLSICAIDFLGCAPGGGIGQRTLTMKALVLLRDEAGGGL